MIKIQAMVMKLSDDKKELFYKNGNVYYSKHKWWDDSIVKQNVIPVAINYMFTAENIIGYVTKFEKNKDNEILATMEMEIDEDLEMRFRHSIFLAGLINVKKKDDLSIGTIHSVGMVSKSNYPFKDNNLAKWRKL